MGRIFFPVGERRDVSNPAYRHSSLLINRAFACPQTALHLHYGSAGIGGPLLLIYNHEKACDTLVLAKCPLLKRNDP